MPVELSQLHELAYGRKTELEIGSLPYALSRRLGCHPGLVFLGKREFEKIVRSHMEVRLLEMLQLPFLIKNGDYYQEGKRPANHLTAYYELPEDGLLYVAGLKWADGGREIWIQTFHRIGLQKALRRQAISTLLRKGS